jgi:hypothetical protein
MALKRLDEEFDLKSGTQLLPYMKRLLPSLEGRFQSLETQQDVVQQLTEEIRAAALTRMNEILIPATEDIIAVTKLGFLLGPSSTERTLAIGPTYFIIDEGPQRSSFTPSPYLIVEREANITDYAIARLDGYNNTNGELLCTITAYHGNPGPWSDWVISSTPGMADSTKIYHDEIAPMHATVVADHAEVLVKHQEIMDAAEALAESGLDVNAFIRRDGTVPFIALQTAVHPPQGSNDATIPTTGWTRSRIIEYAGNALMKTGGEMSGQITLPGPPTNALHATTKAYVDSIIGQGGTVNGLLTIRSVNPTLRLQSTSPQQGRIVEAYSSAGALRWQEVLADNTAETGSNAGSNYVLQRFTDGGAYIGPGLHISRQTAALTAYGTIAATAGLSVTGATSVVGDLNVYRAATPNTGVLYLNQAKTAYHFYDGATHQFTAGGISMGGSPLTSGHINCYSIYTQGYGTTTWGLTSHGQIDCNGALVVRGDMVMEGGANFIRFYDNTWGNMYLHHQDNNIGFLNNGGGWIWYINNDGHMWAAQYGWLHDYVNGRASAYAWDAANYRYNQCVTRCRWVHAGDIDFGGYWYQNAEIGNACITGLNIASAYYGGPGVYWARWRQPQHLIAGGWYTSNWES